MIHRPPQVFSGVLRKGAGPALVALQVAIAIAVITNASQISVQLVRAVIAPTGLDVNNTFVIVSSSTAHSLNLGASLQTDLAYLRNLPGVVAATATKGIPLTSDGSSHAVWRGPGGRSRRFDAVFFGMDQEGLSTLGTHVISGRNFRPYEVITPSESSAGRASSELLVTERLAEMMFPGKDAVGKVIFDTKGRPLTIIGVVANFIGNFGLGSDPESVAIVPKLPTSGDFVTYLVRARPDMRDVTMRSAAEHLADASSDRVIVSTRPLEYYEREHYSPDRNAAIFLSIVSGLMLLVSCLGIYCLAAFNVTVRRMEIATRRAVGARKRDIAVQLLGENAVTIGIGLMSGGCLALGVGYVLSYQYQLPRLEPWYLFGESIILFCAGQLAVLRPVRRAAAVPPAMVSYTP